MNFITLKDVRMENVPGQALRIWNTDLNTHNVIRLERMSVSNTGYDTRSSPALDLRLKNAYVLIRNCLLKGIALTSSTVISVTFASKTMSRMSTVTVAQNLVEFCSGGGVIVVNNVGQNNGTLRMTKNNMRHNLVDESRNVVQLVNMSVSMDDNLFYNNSGKYLLEIGSELETIQLPVRADGNVFWFNTALNYAAKCTVLLHASDVMFRGNILNNPSYTYELSSQEMGDVNAIDAKVDCANNWWGSGLAHVIKRRIRDGHKVEGLPFVVSSPFETVPPSGLYFSSKCLIGVDRKRCFGV